MRHQPFSDEEFHFIYSRVPRVTVEVVVIINGGVVLVQRQEKSWHGQWHIPGGTVMYKEPLIAAVKRLAKEELDLEVIVGRQIDYIEYPSEEQERGFGWSVGIAFECTPISTPNQDLWLKDKIAVYTTIPTTTIEEQKPLLEGVLTRIKKGGEY